MAQILDNLIRLNNVQIGSAAEVLSKSFQGDPLMVYFSPDLAKRDKQLLKMFKFLVKYGVKYGEVYATSNKFEGVSIWLPSEKVEMSFWQMIRSGALSVMMAFGFETMTRILNYMKYSSDLHKKYAPFKHWYLQFIGVSPEFRGKGFASALLKPMLERIDSEGLQCFLETQNLQNISFYEHFGFKMVEQSTIPETKINHLVMIRGK
jgi:GNAT superfamily N-acetyltransferase